MANWPNVLDYLNTYTHTHKPTCIYTWNVQKYTHIFVCGLCIDMFTYVYRHLHMCFFVFVCKWFKVCGMLAITSIFFFSWLLNPGWIRSSEYESSRFQCLFIFRYISKSQMLIQILADICKLWISHKPAWPFLFNCYQVQLIQLQKSQMLSSQETSKSHSYPFLSSCSKRWLYNDQGYCQTILCLSES